MRDLNEKWISILKQCVLILIQSEFLKTGLEKKLPTKMLLSWKIQNQEEIKASFNKKAKILIMMREQAKKVL